MLVARAAHAADAGFGGVDVYGVVGRFHVQADLLLLVLPGKGGNLGRVERGDIARNGVDALELEVDIVDAEGVVEPLDLLIDEVVGDPRTGTYLALHCGRWRLAAQGGRGHARAHHAASAPSCP